MNATETPSGSPLEPLGSAALDALKRQRDALNQMATEHNNAAHDHRLRADCFEQAATCLDTEIRKLEQNAADEP